MPDAGWPHIADPLNITAEDHARHSEKPGIPYPGDLVPGQQSHKQAKLAMKFVNKPHSMPKRKATRHLSRRKKRD